ncbi:hypothetical protein MIND_00310700 [Mycena indigotica]|uniref:Uncharacterized protein n=1 Tax=Mycena indigotica TaxID=2126181 RepID=A0A8H6WEF1_9AGAR|nr:uncharacterized protein MIND_00310700 [Mycena indigotica]KAF7309399.1 hypothetical protein MIND_00310700 [Mycena indigotica]
MVEPVGALQPSVEQEPDNLAQEASTADHEQASSRPIQHQSLPWNVPSSPWASQASYSEHNSEPLVVPANPFDRPSRRRRKRVAREDLQPAVQFSPTPFLIPSPLTHTVSIPSEDTPFPIDPAHIPLPSSRSFSSTSRSRLSTSSVDIPPSSHPTSPIPVISESQSYTNRRSTSLSSPAASSATLFAILPHPVTTPTRKGRISDQLAGLLGDIANEFEIVTDGLEKFYGYAIFLRIPSLYFSRVARIFEDAQTSKPDIRRMARARATQWKRPNEIFTWADYDPTPLPSSLLHLRASWENFIDSLIREWKTFNVVSVLLMSAILTLLQIDSAGHPITRTTALFSLMCSLFSLLYGCMYITRFGTMRKMHKAAALAQALESNNDTVNIWWNAWIMLAMPLTWLAWSIVTFLASIMSFIWLSGSSQDALPTLSPRAALGVRLALTCVMAFGILYFGLIVREFQHYGDAMDRAWMESIKEDLELLPQPLQAPPVFPAPFYNPYVPYPPMPYYPSMAPYPPRPPPRPATPHSLRSSLSSSVSRLETRPSSPSALSSRSASRSLPEAIVLQEPHTQEPPIQNPNALLGNNSLGLGGNLLNRSSNGHATDQTLNGMVVADDEQRNSESGLTLDKDNRARFEQALLSAWSGRMGDDGVETASLSARDPLDPHIVQQVWELWNMGYFDRQQGRYSVDIQAGSEAGESQAPREAV